MERELARIRDSGEKDIRDAHDPQALERIRIAYLGRKGALTLILRSLKDMPGDKRKRIGGVANQMRRELEQLIDEKTYEIRKTHHESLLQKEWIDVTRPGTRQERGHLHPLTNITREIIAIFSGLGFETVEGPEVETEWYNFDALNMPPYHPARDMWDTLWLRHKAEVGGRRSEIGEKNNKLLLRTHTSPVQVRYMESHNPPIRIIAPGRVYRYEATDASHDIQFNQLEGLVVDKNISIANFKAIIQEFFSKLFKTKTNIRLRPSYFPFTEPSFEVDISCTYCRDVRVPSSKLHVLCSVCKQSRWLEIAGAGMVHPNVFKAAGYNPKNVAGFAFGMGIDRLAMMKYKIPDIRLFRSGDVRFLKQF
jgi:phenylalanyl-tRNA synthetase alpha chain